MFSLYKALNYYFFSVFIMLPLSTKEGGKRKTTVVGPWGGNGGTPWDDGIYNAVREITVVYGHCIDSITVVYDKKGKPVKANTHGGCGGTQTAEIKLEYPDEYLVSVTGNYCLLAYGGTAIIRSLKFQSNRRTFGPFGIEEGTTFTYNVEGGKIVGLKGRNGWYIDAIGFHVSPAPTKLSESSEEFQKARELGYLRAPEKLKRLLPRLKDFECITIC